MKVLNCVSTGNNRCTGLQEVVVRTPTEYAESVHGRRMVSGDRGSIQSTVIDVALREGRTVTCAEMLQGSGTLGGFTTKLLYPDSRNTYCFGKDTGDDLSSTHVRTFSAMTTRTVTAIGNARSRARVSGKLRLTCPNLLRAARIPRACPMIA